MIEEFAREMQQRQTDAGGLLRSAIGKARGQALRLALVLEISVVVRRRRDGAAPSEISARAFAGRGAAGRRLFLPMAERVYGDAAAAERERGAATLARWIMAERPAELACAAPAACRAAAGAAHGGANPHRRRCAGRGGLVAARRRPAASSGSAGASPMPSIRGCGRRRREPMGRDLRCAIARL